MVYLVTGPSGAGKTWLLQQSGIERVTTYTTRPPRCGEEDGVDYHFVTKEVFMEMVEAGLMAEYAEFYGNFYGTSKTPLLQAGERALIIEPEGSANIGKFLDELGVPFRRVWIATPICLRHLFLSQSRDASEAERRLHDGIEGRWQQLGLNADIVLPVADPHLFKKSIA